MAGAYANARSAVLWAVSLLHFGVMAVPILLLTLLLDHRKLDWAIKIHCHNVKWLSGMKVRYHYAPGFDRSRTCLFMCNHVNLFDPFVLYNGIPQVARGLELESHFQIPVYGWMMRRFGCIPVSDTRSPSGMKKTFRMTQEALESGISLVIFPEGRRTLDGRVRAFQNGGFVLAQRFGYPIVPISIVGSFHHKRKGNWLLRPARIDVYFYDVVETAGLTREDLPALRDRVRATIAQPVDEYFARLEQHAGAPPAR